MVPVLGMRGGFSLDLDLEDEDGSGEVVFHQESTVVKPLQLGGQVVHGELEQG